MAKTKITDEDVKACQSKGMDIKQIAEKYGVAPYTVMRKIQNIELEERRKAGGSRKGIPAFEIKSGGIVLTPVYPKFNLGVGDIISAIEEEISKNRRSYKIIEIYKEVYICETRTGGKFRTAFRKKDYKTAHDSHHVKLVAKRGELEDEKE